MAEMEKSKTNKISFLGSNNIFFLLKNDLFWGKWYILITHKNSKNTKRYKEENFFIKHPKTHHSEIVLTFSELHLDLVTGKVRMDGILPIILTELKKRKKL